MVSVFLTGCYRAAGWQWSHSVLTPHPPNTPTHTTTPPLLPVQTHLLCLPLGRRKIIRYFNGCQICFPNLLKGYRCYTRTSAYIWINVNFVTREIYCLPQPTTVHKLNRHVFTKCNLRVIYKAEVTDCSLIEQPGKKHISKRCDEGINNSLCTFIWTSDTWRLCIVSVRTAGGRIGGKCGNMNEWHMTPLADNLWWVYSAGNFHLRPHLTSWSLSSPDTAEILSS